MWIVAKYKSKEFNLLKETFTEFLGESPSFYIPKIKYQKIIGKKFMMLEKLVLEGYLICYHSKFKDSKTLLKLKYTRGLSYFLDGLKQNQKEISYFVDRCKKFEDKEGYLSQDFFDDINIKRGKFISSPFTNLVFDIISRQGNKLRILIGNLKTTIYKNSSNLYRPI